MLQVIRLVSCEGIIAYSFWTNYLYVDIYLSFVESGHYFYIGTTDVKREFKARLRIPFMTTTNKCMAVFYNMQGTKPSELTIYKVMVSYIKRI